MRDYFSSATHTKFSYESPDKHVGLYAVSEFRNDNVGMILTTNLNGVPQESHETQVVSALDYSI